MPLKATIPSLISVLETAPAVVRTTRFAVASAHAKVPASARIDPVPINASQRIALPFM
jgi:hypothetical protein